MIFAEIGTGTKENQVYGNQRQETQVERVSEREWDTQVTVPNRNRFSQYDTVYQWEREISLMGQWKIGFCLSWGDGQGSMSHSHERGLLVHNGKWDESDSSPALGRTALESEAETIFPILVVSEWVFGLCGSWESERDGENFQWCLYLKIEHPRQWYEIERKMRDKDEWENNQSALTRDVDQWVDPLETSTGIPSLRVNPRNDLSCSPCS
jgi:hypothetical protein